MSTKNVALATHVYERLARYKRESESFSRAIDRLLTIAEIQHVGSDILKGIHELPPLSEDEARTMLDVVDRSRTAETWNGDDLR